MVSLANRRSVMTLFSGQTDLYSHQVRMVLAEKGITVDVIEVDPAHKPEDLIDLNPYNSLPTLVDRDLVLYDSDIVMEYIDERYPHPPLLPVYPVARAKSRLLIRRIKHDWLKLYDQCSDTQQLNIEKAREVLIGSLVASAPLFAEKAFFMSEEMSLVDCYIAPLLWRLADLEISLPSSADAVIDYADRIYEREGFQQSLTDAERELR